jgi:hypothetical protein
MSSEGRKKKTTESIHFLSTPKKKGGIMNYVVRTEKTHHYHKSV